MSAISLRLPDSLHNATRKLAKKEHISINQFIMLAVAEKLSALDAENIIQERAKKGDRKKFMSVLKKVPDVEPDEQDKL